MISDITEDEAKDMLAKLTKHYREPVMPIKKYCAALETWASIMENLEGTKRRMGSSDSGYYNYIRRIRIDIHKSNLLFRLLYLQEPLRTEQCPIHKGQWNGQAQVAYGCVNGCDGTGWLKTPGMVQTWLENIRKNFDQSDEDIIDLLKIENLPKRKNMNEEYFKYRTYYEWAYHIGREDLIPEEEKF